MIVKVMLQFVSALLFHFFADVMRLIIAKWVFFVFFCSVLAKTFSPCLLYNHFNYECRPFCTVKKEKEL